MGSYDSRVIFCSDRTDCMYCEFMLNCDVMPEDEYYKLVKCKIASVYGDVVNEKTTVS